MTPKKEIPKKKLKEVEKLAELIKDKKTILNEDDSEEE